ncbi:hypothetical protein AB0I69_20270 [Streptomyces sp. NPDC050508]|uniref:hypothetical protein n=1 Tax=Streptomyces sp. NPDC050508 TaxID=3155405 RepID=UPI00342BD0E6
MCLRRELPLRGPTAAYPPHERSAGHGEGFFDYDGLLHMLTGGALSVYRNEECLESTFVVDRREDGEDSIFEVWFP